MSIKVLIKRRVAGDQVGALKKLIAKLRSATLAQPGYVAGETLKRIDKPGEFLVVSKWRSRYDWEQWFANDQRIEIHARIDALLGSPTEFETYEYE